MVSAVFLGDAWDVLPRIAKPGAAIITSLPDIEESGRDLDSWVPFFEDGVKLCLRHADPVVIYQTDRKREGRWISKSCLAISAAAEEGARLLWHKIVLLREPGKIDLFRPSYSHMMAFGRRISSGRATPDVIHGGEKIYQNGIGKDAARAAVAFCQEKGAEAIIDPFCGRGTVLRIAEEQGIPALGIDIDPELASEEAP
jgi:hypothetical protein